MTEYPPHWPYLRPSETFEKLVTAERHDDGKPDLHYLDPWFEALCEVSRTCTTGEGKYARGNYLLGQPHSQLLAAAQRHSMKYGSWRHPDYDGESHCHHIAHAIFNLLQLLQNDLTQGMDFAGVDDRLTPHRRTTENE